MEEDTYKSGDLEDEVALGRVREVYERAVAQVPPGGEEKRHWRRYIFTWLNYALFEELVTKVRFFRVGFCFPLFSGMRWGLNF